MMRAVFLIALLVLVGPITANAGKLDVSVSILPQQYLVEQIGGDVVDVHVMIPPGASPHHFEPSARQIARLSETKLYFSIGINFERSWMDRFKAANPEMTVIDSTQGITRRSMTSHEAHSHSHDNHGHGDNHHGHKDSHADHARDPHVWLSPVLMRLQAENVRDALIEHAPQHSELFHQRFAALATAINQLDSEILHKLADIPTERRQFLVFHPAFGYFADAYGFEQIAIESEGKEPGPRELNRIINQVREQNITTIFAEPQFPQGSAKVIAREINGSVETLDPLAKDWLEGMRHTANKIKQATLTP